MKRRGKIDTLVSLVKDNFISISEAANRLGISEDKVKEYLKDENRMLN